MAEVRRRRGGEGDGAAGSGRRGGAAESGVGGTSVERAGDAGVPAGADGTMAGRRRSAGEGGGQGRTGGMLPEKGASG